MRLVRQHYPWRIGQSEIVLGSRTFVMGVLNVGPAEKGGAGLDPDAALDRALALQDEGADLFDIYAGPLTPDARSADADLELRSLVPVLRKLRHRLDVPISINTFHAATAERALELGADIINDVSGLSVDPELARVVNRRDAGLILTHMRGAPDTWARQAPVPDPVALIGRDLESALGRARSAGIDRRRIVVDPGLELGKRGMENYRVLAELDRLGALQQPVLVSPSRKSFLTDTVRASESQWLLGAATAVTVAVCCGAHIVRVHDVKTVREVVEVADRFLRAAEKSRV